jgi:hypothetical protein
LIKILKVKAALPLVFIFCVQFGNAQLTDLARLEYSFIPKSKSEDQYTRLRAFFNYPVELKKDSYLVVGAEYNRVLLNIEDDYSFDTASLDKIHIIDLNLAYTFKWNKKWRFGVKFNPRIASTLTHSLSSDDYFMNGGVYFINRKTAGENVKRDSRLILGLTYNSTTGLPFPLPFLSYFRKIDERWAYTAGIPKSNLRYYFNEKNNMQIFIGLDGYLAHLQKPMVINGKEAEHISLSVAISGFGYEYCFTKHLVAYLYTGYTLRLNNVIRSENRDEIFKLDDINAFYLRSGLKFKL